MQNREMLKFSFNAEKSRYYESQLKVLREWRAQFEKNLEYAHALLKPSTEPTKTSSIQQETQEATLILEDLYEHHLNQTVLELLKGQYEYNSNTLETLKPPANADQALIVQFNTLKKEFKVNESFWKKAGRTIEDLKLTLQNRMTDSVFFTIADIDTLIDKGNELLLKIGDLNNISLDKVKECYTFSCHVAKVQNEHDKLINMFFEKSQTHIDPKQNPIFKLNDQAIKLLQAKEPISQELKNINNKILSAMVNYAKKHDDTISEIQMNDDILKQYQEELHCQPLPINLDRLLEEQKKKDKKLSDDLTFIENKSKELITTFAAMQKIIDEIKGLLEKDILSVEDRKILKADYEHLQKFQQVKNEYDHLMSSRAREDILGSENVEAKEKLMAIEANLNANQALFKDTPVLSEQILIVQKLLEARDKLISQLNEISKSISTINTRDLQNIDQDSLQVLDNHISNFAQAYETYRISLEQYILAHPNFKIKFVSDEKINKLFDFHQRIKSELEARKDSIKKESEKIKEEPEISNIPIEIQLLEKIDHQEFDEQLIIIEKLAIEQFKLKTIVVNEIDQELLSIHDKIKAYTEQDFDFIYKPITKEASEEKILIKDVRLMNDDELNPLHAHEVKIQALRYLRGMLLIINNSPNPNTQQDNSPNPNTQQAMLTDVIHQFNTYQDKVADKPANEAATFTRDLTEEFAKILQTHLEIKPPQSFASVTMARDLGTLLEAHSTIMTLSMNDNKGITIEKARLVKISKDYYDSQIYDKDNKNLELHRANAWFTSATAKAGLTSTDDNWLATFFNKNREALVKQGVPTPSSARWLPLPAANQVINTIVLTKDQNNQLSFQQSNFVRMGITTAFEVKDPRKQEDLAVQQMVEIIKANLDAAIQNYKTVYDKGKDEPIQFYVNYQTLLTPHYLENLLPYKDNNTKFVEMAKRAIKKVENYHPNTQGIQVKFTHTNSGVNKRANWISAKSYSEDRASRLAKIGSTILLIDTYLPSNLRIVPRTELDENKSIPIATTKNLLSLNAANGIADHIKALENNRDLKLNPRLQVELISRLRASYYLTLALENKAPFDQVKQKYQRQIMIAALEHLTLGQQGLTLGGCKSARDRTSVFASAIKTMLENPEAMHDFNQLNRGIIRSLLQGHHFRAMIHHTAVVKIAAVHKYFFKQFSQSLQDSITAQKIFSKKTKEIPKDREHLKKNNSPDVTDPSPKKVPSLEKVKKATREPSLSPLPKTEAEATPPNANGGQPIKKTEATHQKPPKDEKQRPEKKEVTDFKSIEEQFLTALSNLNHSIKQLVDDKIAAQGLFVSNKGSLQTQEKHSSQYGNGSSTLFTHTHPTQDDKNPGRENQLTI